MRRFVKTMAPVLICAALLAGCHGSRGPDAFEMPAEMDESAKTVVTFWAKNDTNKNQTAIYEQTINDFEKLYPDITVNMRLYTDYGKIYNDVITNIATGTTPDVCITYPDHIATYLTGNNVVVPLDDLFTDPDYGLGGKKLRFEGVNEEEIVPEFLDECRIGDRHYALPFMRSTEACYVNRTYVEKLGFTMPETLTWDFIWEVSEAAMAKNADGTYAVNGQKIMIPFIYKSSDNMMISYLKQAGAGYSREDGTVEIFNDTMRDFLKTVADHTATGAFSTFKVSGYPANFLNAGQCIFAVDSTAGATWMGTDAPLLDISTDALVDFETEVMTIPQIDPDDPYMISQGPSVCVFNKRDPQQVLASWLFAQFLLTDSVQTAYAETEGYIPVTLSAGSSDEYRDYLAAEGKDNNEHYSVKIRASKLLLDNIGHTFTTPVYNGSASLRDASSALIENTVKSVRRKKVVDDAFISKLEKDAVSLYRLDQLSRGSSGKMHTDISGTPLPAASKALIICLAAAWGGIAAALVLKRRKVAVHGSATRE
jgi:multiple sugar transport system substrate-binding protein